VGTCLSNLEATAAVLQEAERRQVPPSHIICTGDVVAYCAEPQETVDLVRSAGIVVLQGNCEESLGARSADCGCGFEEGSACSLLSVAWYGYSNARLDDDSREWMRRLPTAITLHLGRAACSVIHGGATDVSRFVFASSPQSDKVSEVAALPPVPPPPHAAADGGSRPPDVIIAGHSGIPFSQQLPDGTLWHNAGVVGMPANDGACPS
jgi:predicted phosphodiesterase